MHAAVDLDRLLQFSLSVAAETATAMVVGFLDFVRSTSSMVLAAASNFGFTAFAPDWSNGEMMEVAAGGATNVFDCCDLCGLTRRRRFVGGEMVEYCSESCQSSNWYFERKTKCARTKSPHALPGRKVSLLSAAGSSEIYEQSKEVEIYEQSKEILFPYEEFIELFNCEKPGCPPCGLINGGNSCFANVVLQCLTYTRPLAAYFLEKDHKIDCRMDRWCFVCAFQTHVERISWSHSAFIPINILSRLHNIGDNLERGEQADAHEFMRFAIDKMQSVFLNEFGGEKAAHPRYNETSFVQHVFGGCLQSQVICSNCNNVSDQFEHMMDLTVEIHGDAESLEECLDQFTAEELLHGDNMYNCDCCSAYVMARKRLSIQQAPNILTIALKRFQRGRSNKLNKTVSFPETLDLRSYMNGLEDGNDFYKLYAVIVHVDMLDSFGHYICYIKDFGGNWYRIDDDKVSNVGLDEVLSQEAYMLLYSRICPRPSCLLPAALLKERENKKRKIETVDQSTEQPSNSANISPAKCSEVEVDDRAESSLAKSAEVAEMDIEMATHDTCSPTSTTESHDSNGFHNSPKEDDFPLRLDFFKARDTNGGLCQDLGAAKNCTFEKNGRYDISPYTTGEIQRENSSNCTYMQGTARCEGNNSYVSSQNGSRAMSDPLPSPPSIGRQRWEKFFNRENTVSEPYSSVFLDHGIREAAAGRKSVGLSSDVKLKPLSALGRKRRKELFKQENEGKTPRMHLNPSPRFLSEDDRFLKYDLRACVFFFLLFFCG